jgi:hypothetical protein
LCGRRCKWRKWRKRWKIAKGEWLKVLLLLDSYDHLLEIVGGDVSFATATTTVDRVLSLNLRMCDIDGR